MFIFEKSVIVVQRAFMYTYLPGKYVYGIIYIYIYIYIYIINLSFFYEFHIFITFF